jgi:hypothetical protein
MAEISAAVHLAAHIHMCVAVRGLHDLVGQVLHGVLHFRGIELASDESFDGEYRVIRVRDGLPFGDLANKPFTALGESHDRRGGPASLRVRDHNRFATLHHRNAGIGGPEIDTDYLSHMLLLR